jgi:Ricin-type beta-trefoil lectin domain
MERREDFIVANSLRLIPAVGILLLWVPTPSTAQYVDQGFYYKLSTQFRGTGMKLDVFNGGPKNNLTRLEPDQDLSGQFWRFEGNADGTFRLSTQFRGLEMCLDIFNGGPKDNQPHLTRCANLSGQHWNIKQDGDAVRLTTQFRGPGRCLDIFNSGPNNNQPHLSKCANLSGQLWTLTKTDKPVDDATKQR